MNLFVNLWNAINGYTTFDYSTHWYQTEEPIMRLPKDVRRNTFHTYPKAVDELRSKLIEFDNAGLVAQVRFDKFLLTPKTYLKTTPQTVVEVGDIVSLDHCDMKLGFKDRKAKYVAIAEFKVAEEMMRYILTGSEDFFPFLVERGLIKAVRNHEVYLNDGYQLKVDTQDIS